MTTTDALNARRVEVLEEHFASEVDQELTRRRTNPGTTPTFVHERFTHRRPVATADAVS